MDRLRFCKWLLAGLVFAVPTLSVHAGAPPAATKKMDTASAVNMAGRQRMLSQRMAKFYFYRTWGLYDIPADMELHLSRAHFTAVLIQIENSPLASAQIKAGVARVRREWEPYQQVLFASREPAKMRKDAARVAELSERVLAVTEELVAQIVAQAKSQQSKGQGPK